MRSANVVLLLLILMGLHVLPAYADGQPVNQSNLLINGDAEKQTGWKLARGCRYQDSDAFEGKVCLTQSLSADAFPGYHAFGQRINIQEGLKYRVSYACKYLDIKEGFVILDFSYPDGKPMRFQDYRIKSTIYKGTRNAWFEEQFEFIGPKGVGTVSLGLRLNSPGQIWWDKVVLMEVTAQRIDAQYDQSKQQYDLRNSVGVVRAYDVQKIKDLSIKWVRYNIDWRGIQPDARDRWNLQQMDIIEAKLVELQQADIKVMASLGYAPQWAARDPTANGIRRVAKDLNDWRNYVAMVVARFDKYIASYRIMNEPDHMWDRGSQPVEYQAFLTAASQILRAASPDKPIIMAGLSGAPASYLSTMYESGAKGTFDAAACQPYTGRGMAPEPGHLAQRLHAYRMAMSMYGDQSPIWITESGYILDNAVNLQKQAAYNMRSHLIALTCGAGITKFFYYILQDQNSGDQGTQTGGLYDQHWKIKPLGIAIGTLAKMTNPVTRYLGALPNVGNEQTYNRLFEREDGMQLWVLWQNETDLPIHLEFESAVQMIKWDGTTCDATTRFDIDLDMFPVFFLGHMPSKTQQATLPGPVGFDAVKKLASTRQTFPWLDHQPTEHDWDQAPQLALITHKSPDEKPIAHARVIGTPQGLAVRVQVDDTSPAQNSVGVFDQVWSQDALEIFINTNAEVAPAGFVTNDCYQFIVTPGNQGHNAKIWWANQGSTGIQKVIKDADINVQLRPDGSGYRMAVLLPWKPWTKTPQSDARMGLDLIVRRSDASGKRDATVVWAGTGHNAQNASDWAAVQFKP